MPYLFLVGIGPRPHLLLLGMDFSETHTGEQVVFICMDSNP